MLLARIVGQSGQPITQASLSSIAYTVSDLTAWLSAGTGTFTISSTVFDALQQADPRWTVDSAMNPGPDGAWGYNFAAVVPAADFPATALTPDAVLAAPHRYQCDVTFTPVSGEQFRVPFRWTPVPVWG